MATTDVEEATAGQSGADGRASREPVFERALLLELVLVSAAELSAVRESLADKSQQTKIHGSDADWRDKSTREALCGRRDKVMPILEKQLAALYKRLQPIADELLASRKDQVAGLEGGASADKKGE